MKKMCSVVCSRGVEREGMGKKPHVEDENK